MSSKRPASPGSGHDEGAKRVRGNEREPVDRNLSHGDAWQMMRKRLFAAEDRLKDLRKQGLSEQEYLKSQGWTNEDFTSWHEGRLTLSMLIARMTVADIEAAGASAPIGGETAGGHQEEDPDSMEVDDRKVVPPENEEEGETDGVKRNTNDGMDIDSGPKGTVVEPEPEVECKSKAEGQVAAPVTTTPAPQDWVKVGGAAGKAAKGRSRPEKMAGGSAQKANGAFSLAVEDRRCLDHFVGGNCPSGGLCKQHHTWDDSVLRSTRFKTVGKARRLPPDSQAKYDEQANREKLRSDSKAAPGGSTVIGKKSQIPVRPKETDGPTEQDS